tara:strand:+ start:1979 stop:4840 length:2862 start_codon:yes stop_codon:yes gene_type:complete
MDALSSLYPTNQIGSDGFAWWIGQIESDKQGDFKQSGRYRVRIVGYHPQSCDVVHTNDLPFASTMMPVTNPHTPGGSTSVSDQLGPGVWVVGFFLDIDKQQPVIMGSIGRVANSKGTSDDEDPTPGETGCKSFTTYVDAANKLPFDQPLGTTAKPTITDAGFAPTGLSSEDEDGTVISTTDTGYTAAKNAPNTATNPAGTNWCVEIADKCGKETDLGNTMNRLLSEMLYETQRNGGKLGDYLVGELSGELFDAVGIGRKYVTKAQLVVRTFVASVKGFILEKLKAGIKDLINMLLYPSDTGNALTPVTKFFNDILDDVGCSMADLGDRLASFLEDLIFGYLFNIYKAAACQVDKMVEGILNKIQSLMEELLSRVLGPLQDILGAVASAINIIGDTINYVLDLLGIQCDGPGKSCSKTTKICTDCATDKREDFLDQLLKNITDDLFPATGEDWSQYTCDEAYEGTTLKNTEIVFVGGIQDPQEEPTIVYNISNLEVVEGDVAVFTVTRDGFLDVSSSVRYSTRNGSAQSPNDYEQSSGILGFAPGESSKTISVRTFADSEREFEEDFYMRIFKDTPGTVLMSATNNVGRCVITDSVITTPPPVDPPVGPGETPPPPSSPPPPTYPPLVIPDQFPQPENTGDDDDDDTTDTTLTPTYFVQSDKSLVKEGEFVTYTITTKNVSNGTVLFYRLFGPNITPGDIVSGSLSGSFVVNNNTSVVIVGIEEDIENEDDETLIFGIIGTGAQASVIITSDIDGFTDEEIDELEDSSSNIPPSDGKSKIPTAGVPITGPDGGFIEIPIDTPGTPYVEPPAIIITGEGRRAAAIPLLNADGLLTEIRVTDPGLGYKLNTPATSQKECIIDSFTMLNPGREYTSQPTVYINGDPDIAEAIVENGKVVSVRIKNRSIVFDRYPKVIILGGGGYAAKFIPSFACLDPEARVKVGSAKIGTGKYIDCP